MEPVKHPPANGWRHWVLRTFGSALLIALGCASGALLGEIGFRLAGQDLRFPVMFVPDTSLVYRLKPGIRERTVNAGYFDYSYTVNRQGFRATREYGRKQAGVKRVLVLGDSFTFGVGVDDGATYPQRVEDRLSAWCGPGRVEVINGGVGGYGTSHELVFFERYGRPLAPDVVVLGFMAADPEDNLLRGLHRLDGDLLVDVPADMRAGWGRIRASEHVPAFDFLTRHSTLFNWVRFQIGKISSQLEERRLERAEDEGGGAASTAVATPATPGANTSGSHREDAKWRLTRRLLERFADEVTQSEAKLVTAIIPHGGTLGVYERAGRDTTLRTLYESCEDYELTCVDVSVHFLRHRPGVQWESLYLREGHFNESGYDLVAEAVAPQVARVLGCPT
ncbi:MAG: SGNH/GDSL hydrolase family protein [Gemmatimonadota bacterium]|nr:SGNH/GDSL hydrolase family protein [Gemmatimonadota bacterium]